MLANVTFWGVQQGGRKKPPLSGYNPHLHIGDVFTSCKIESIDGAKVFDFDKEYGVRLTLLYPELYSGRFQVGDDVNFFEGSRHVAKGKVFELGAQSATDH